MLIVAFTFLGITVLVGLYLAVLHLLNNGAVSPSWKLAALHGILVFCGFVCLVLALRGPSRGLNTGTTSFGLIAGILIILAILAGGAILVMKLCLRRISGVLIGAHATLAIAGLVILSAYILFG
jgi:hypothetical protein